MVVSPICQWCYAPLRDTIYQVAAENPGRICNHCDRPCRGPRICAICAAVEHSRATGRGPITK